MIVCQHQCCPSCHLPVCWILSYVCLIDPQARAKPGGGATSRLARVSDLLCGQQPCSSAQSARLLLEECRDFTLRRSLSSRCH